MESSKQVVVFDLDETQYGFPISQVSEIIRYMAPNKIPNSLDYIEGIINLRGKVHVVINLRKILGMDWKKPDGNTKIIVSNSSNLGFIVDEVNMIVTSKEEEITNDVELPIYMDKNYLLDILRIDGEIIMVLNMLNIISMM